MFLVHSTCRDLASALAHLLLWTILGSRRRCSATSVPLHHDRASVITSLGGLSHELLDDRSAPRLLSRALGGSIDTHTLYTPQQKFTIQTVACVLSGISLLVTLVTLYWFFRMRKRFRHKLIMLLVVGDVIRSFWLFIFPLVTFSQGMVPTESHFCQASGFLTQMGIEMADYAVLLIAIHTALQIFYPQLSGGREGGLYRWRYPIFSLGVLIPPVLCSLAFIRSRWAYESNGPTCSLPIRPFWYRLAVSWIPRYTILFTIFSLYVAIYVKVHREFGTFRLSRRKRQDHSVTPVSFANFDEKELDRQIRQSGNAGMWNQQVATRSAPGHSGLGGDASPCDDSIRRWSDGTTLVGQSECGTRKCSVITLQQNRLSMPTLPTQTFDGQTGNKAQDDSDVVVNGRNGRLQSGQLTRAVLPEEDLVGKKLQTKAMRKKQTAIRRHIRYLFIYPICYFLIWLIPFVQHVQNYNQYRAQNPLWVLNMFSIACLSSMGTLDCLIFNIREKPWRSIPGSDGTLPSSFMFWRHDMLRKISYNASEQTSESGGSTDRKSSERIPDSTNWSRKPGRRNGKELDDLATVNSEEDIDAIGRASAQPAELKMEGVRDFALESRIAGPSRQ